MSHLNLKIGSLALCMFEIALNAHSQTVNVEYCPGHGPRQNPNDVMVRVGSVCVDKYEASVWSKPNGQGDQYPQSVPRFPDTFPRNGNWTVPLYATSMPGVSPARFITWFQAQQACALSGKRLLTNAEWQMAAAGTPDPGVLGDGVNACNTNTTGPLTAGTRAQCISNWGVADMVGNVNEWVADWVQGPGVSAGAVVNVWNPVAYEYLLAEYGNDYVGGINDAFNDVSPQTGEQIPGGINPLPAAISRGGMWTSLDIGGVFMLDATKNPGSLNNALGFRCGKNAPYERGSGKVETTRAVQK